MENMKYKLLNTETNETVELTLTEILEEVNRDRSEEWQDYDALDWQEGLEVFTEYVLLD